MFPFHLRSFAATRLWLPALLGACIFLIWINVRRMQRVDTVSRTDAVEAVQDHGSPTGYAGGKRWLIVPEHNNRSYQWIAETQHMLARSEWRLRHIDYENAPFGREVRSASPYRWWLALLARIHHESTGMPLAAAVERVALWADPLLHLILVVVTTLYVARRFGSGTAAVCALALTILFPFAGGFLPGGPDDRSLGRIAVLWSVLPLLAARSAGARSSFLAAGIAGGVGLWIDAASEAPVLVGIALGAILSSLLARRTETETPDGLRPLAPWRLWALGGATTSLLAYLVEYFPRHLDFDLETNHPLYGLAWLGLGELLHRFDAWRSTPRRPWRLRAVLGTAAAALAVAALPMALKWTGARSLLSGDLYASRLSFLPNGEVADNLGSWLARDGLSAAFIATVLPLLWIAPALWIVGRKPADLADRRRIALALGPIAITFVLACGQLAWWAACDGALIGLLVALVGTLPSRRTRWIGAGVGALTLLPGVLRLLPPPATGDIAFTRFEILGLMERGFAHWLADRSDANAVVLLAPPDQTTSLCFHGNFRGIGTTNRDNEAGLEATVRIATATTAEIAKTLIDERGVTHLILPSWDRDLDAFARWRLPNPEDAFVMALHHWAVPSWLEPVAYPLPIVAGFEDQSLVVLKVTDNTHHVVALSRLAEYFIETRRSDLALKIGEALQRYPAHPAALIALAAIEEAGGNRSGFERTLGELAAGLDNGLDRALPWDRRVSLAIVLALGQRSDLARDQVRRCLETADAAKIRSLSTGSLYRLQVLAKAFSLEMRDPELRELSRRLLPAELRARL